MTIIAYRDGVIAADTQVLDLDIRVGTASKIVKNEQGMLAGAAGPSGHCNRFLSWCLGTGELPELERITDSAFLGFVVHKDGTVRFYEEDMCPQPLDAPFYALGAGSAVALGAFAMGATAAQAVAAAIKYDSGCGGEVETLCL